MLQKIICFVLLPKMIFWNSLQLVLPSGTLHTLGSTCCENGRPLITDPLTGQTLCACQVTPGGASYVRLPGLPDGIYGSPGGPHMGPDPSAFYSPLVSILIRRSGIWCRVDCMMYDVMMHSTFYRQYNNQGRTQDLKKGAPLI